MSDAASANNGLGRRRWLILGVIALAQLMVVLDLTVMNIALPSAQRALHFTTVDRQWVVTAYSLAFGSLLLLGGRLADLLGRKVTFLAGLVGFAGVSAIGGASVNFAMLIIARACQGAFAALLVPAALSLLTTTFTTPKDRGKAFGIYGAIAGAGGAIGLLLGGALTEYLSWRWTLYVNLAFAAVAFTGGALLLPRQASRAQGRLGIPGVLPGLRVLQCSHAQLGHAVQLRVPRRRRGAGRCVRGLADPGGPPTAATPGGAGPPPRRRLPVDAHRLGRAVRDLLVPDLLPAADARVLAARRRCGIPADQRRPGNRVQSVHDRADAQDRAQAADRVRDAGRRGRGGLAGPAEPPHRLCRRRARPDHPGLGRLGHGDRSGHQHRHLRRGPPGRRRCLSDRHRRPAARRLGRHLPAEYHLHRRRHLLPGRTPDLGPAHRPPGAHRAGAGARLRHRVLVGRRHLRRRRGHRRHPAPPRAAGPDGRCIPGTGRCGRGARRDGPRRPARSRRS